MRVTVLIEKPVLEKLRFLENMIIQDIQAGVVPLVDPHVIGGKHNRFYSYNRVNDIVF